jgi:histidine ammonia-lyase
MSQFAIRGSAELTPEEVLIEHRHRGTVECAREKRFWLENGNQPVAERDHRQDPYCLRCAMQVHGAVWEELAHCEPTLRCEINSSTDNPLVFPATGKVGYGGNFHAIHPARVSDHIASALTTLGSISERRICLAMNGDRTGLPHFLTANGGLNSGLMMTQTTAAALVSECKSLSFPASVDSIPTNGDQEDHVSMGPIAGLKALRIVDNIRFVLAIELLAAAQALDLRGLDTAPPRLVAIHRRIRQDVPFLCRDRVLSEDIEALATIIQEAAIIKR